VTVLVIAYIGLGANLGDARGAVRLAMDAIAGIDGVVVTRRSSLYGSAPVEADGGDYVNAAVQVRTTLTAYQLLAALQEVEQQAGRERSYRNAPRTLDLDLLLYGDATINSPDLLVPHPRMWERAFVLRPLSELDSKIASVQELSAVAAQQVWLLAD
jgi:2-amino-4-hydroxy-6-hydroxymethyldihydropteridine diphosphokinase